MFLGRGRSFERGWLNMQVCTLLPSCVMVFGNEGFGAILVGGHSSCRLILHPESS